MNRCTVSGNTAFDTSGGGIDNFGGGQLAMTNCTVSGNVADGDGAGVNNYGQGSASVLKHCTIAYNTGIGTGGGIASRTDLGFVASASIEATILAYNRALSGPSDCGGTIVSNDQNVLTTLADCTLTGFTVGDFVGFDPRLGSLQMNGGLTPTHAILKGSVAMDIVQTCDTATDQRGLARPQDGRALNTPICDAGAYEAAKPIVVNSLADPGGTGSCTLRQAIAAATTNTAQGGLGGCIAGFLGSDIPDRITFNVAGKITLTSGALALSDSVMIEGPGATLLKISGNNASPVLSLTDGAAPHTFVLSSVTVADGSPANEATGGGVSYIGSDARLAIDQSTFRDGVPSTSPGGGGAQVGFYGGRGLACLSLDAGRAALQHVRVHHRQHPCTHHELHDRARGRKRVLPGRRRGRTRCSPRARELHAPGVGARQRNRGGLHQRSDVRERLDDVSRDGLRRVRDEHHEHDLLRQPDGHVHIAWKQHLDGCFREPHRPGRPPEHGSEARRPRVQRRPNRHVRHEAGESRDRPRREDGDRGRRSISAVSRAPSRSTSPTPARSSTSPAGDVNGDGKVDVLDVFYLINFLFAGGPAPIGPGGRERRRRRSTCSTSSTSSTSSSPEVRPRSEVAASGRPKAGRRDRVFHGSCSKRTPTAS